MQKTKTKSTTNTKKTASKTLKADNIISSNELDAKQNSGIAALSYMWILFLVPLLGKRDSKFAQFHAKQGMVLFGVEIIAGMFIWFPLFGQLLNIGLIVIAVMGVIKAFNEEWWEIPYINEWSKKIKF